MSDPWAFGWTQVFTILGFLITVGIAIGGFRTFNRWKREKIEEKRIDTAIDALQYVAESKFMLDSIRAEMTFDHEWESMPQFPGDNEGRRGQRGPAYAILKRIEGAKEFFDRGWRLQARCGAIFGPELEETFLLLQRARREMEVAAEMLTRDPHPTHNTEDNRDTWNMLRAALWASYGRLAKEGDKVGAKLTQFRSEVEAACRPVVDREFGRAKKRS